MPIEFIPAICPKCGGELRVPNNVDVIKCMYCGQEIIVHNPNKLDIKLEITRDISKLLNLAKISEESKNYEESYKYYSQVLEVNSEHRASWLGKARGAAMQSLSRTNTLDEAVSYCKIALTYDSDIDDDVKLTINTIAYGCKKFFAYLMQLYTDEYNRKLPANIPDAISQIGGAFQEKRLRKEVQAKFYESCKQPLRAINFCWKTSSTKCVGKTIYESFSVIDKSDWLFQSDYSNLLTSLSNLVAGKYPELEKPKSKECFIATATMGDINHLYIVTLRQYRDNVLITSKHGKLMIHAYYLLSPPLAKLISKNRTLRSLSEKFVVNPAYKKAIKVLKSIDK